VIYILPSVKCLRQNTLQKFGFTIAICIPKTLTTLFLKDSAHSKTTFYGFSFRGGKNLQKLSFLFRLNECFCQCCKSMHKQRFGYMTNNIVREIYGCEIQIIL
jgi:hypothetical protein